MKTMEKTSEVLNDLLRINNDRVEGYERASKETDSEDADLRTVFTEMANQSREFAGELSSHINRTDEEPAEDITISGKIYRAWMDVKATFTGNSRKSILASCEFGEDAAQRAYNTALEADAELPPDERQMIVRQKEALKNSHDRIKAMRDAQTA